jgi:microcin C transport system substrate-binding protein
LEHPVNRRSLLSSALLAPAALAAGPFALPAWMSRAEAEEAKPAWRHGVSLFGDLKYSPGFKRFDYVNANAPKGGTARQIALGTFDNFNQVIAGLKGSLAAGVDLLYDTLLVSALDEVSSEYGLIAEAVSYPGNFTSATYRLRAEAKWHDGKPVTPDDVIFSFNTFKKLNPQSSAYYRRVEKAEKTGDREVTFTFDGPGNRELPQIVGQLAILPKEWWEGTDKDGKKRDVGATTLEPPLGSGAYRIKEFTAGRNIVYERVKDYWGSSVNVNIGRDNFDELHFEYFRDTTVAIEAFKADTVDWRTENSAKNWATAYDFPAVTDKRVLLEEFPINNVGMMQAFAFNIRRAKFKDRLVRLAFNYAFDFEEMNKQIFFGQYKRIASYFEGTDLAATGLPTGRELELLETVRDKVPAELFKKVYSNPVGGNPAAVRSNLREAVKLFKEAGYVVRDQQLVNGKTGEPFTVEFLAEDPNFERVFLFFKPSLDRLGITVSVRSVDEAQFENRLRTWDFDIITSAWPESLSPGNEQRGYWGSQSADESGSNNLIGIKNPAVDAMIEHVIFAKSRDDLVAATKALDRVLLWNYYVVPQWSYHKLRSARWDRFGRPEALPKYGMSAFPTLWWWDTAKVAKTGAPS